jgi:hypothetical protein
MSVLTTHTYSNPREKEKETNKRNSNKRSKAKEKGKGQDHLKETSIGPLRQGQRLDTSQTNHAQAKRTNHQSKTQNHKELPLHTCKLPLNQCNSSWTNACEPLNETGLLQQLSSDWSDQSPSPVRLVDKIAQHLGTTPVGPVPFTGQAGATWETARAQK